MKKEFKRSKTRPILIMALFSLISLSSVVILIGDYKDGNADSYFVAVTLILLLLTILVCIVGIFELRFKIIVQDAGFPLIANT